MDDDGGMRNWGSFYENPLKGNLGLQLMPSVNDRETKPYFFFSNGTATFNPEPSVPTMGFMRDSWMYHHRDTTTSHPAPNPNPNNHNPNPNPNPTHHTHNPNSHHHQHHHQNLTKIPQYYEQLHEPAMATNLQMINPDERVPVSVPVPVPVPETPTNPKTLNEETETPKKKKKKKKASSQLEPTEKPQPKPKKAKKEASSSDAKKERSSSKDGELEKIIINGQEIELSKIPTPVCSCTGGAQQCYRWGIGGWQSACCTNTISVYPLPLSDKRRGARIAGRKMSIGAFRKVLERVVAEGVDLSEPIDLKGFWAKHGTNKFVTIR